MDKNKCREKHKKRIETMKRLETNKYGFGVNEVIGLAAGIIIAAVIVIPGLKTLAQDVMSRLSLWWSNVAISIFS